MNPVQKASLYFNTLKYLKWTQVWHRFTFRACLPKPDFSPAPKLSTACRSLVAFPNMPTSYLGNDSFLFLNDKEVFTGWNDKNRDKLWLYNLHYFDWLRQTELSEEEGNKWITRWIKENPAPAGNGWEPYPLSLRIVNWIKWHLSGHELNEEVRHSLAVQVRFLRKRLEYHLLANHFLANAKALVFAGMFFEGTEADCWLKKGLEIYREQIPEQILDDGGHFELSPMYHSIILEDLLDLVNLQVPIELDDTIKRMNFWLAVMTGPDGKIALFNDAADGIALSPHILQKYSESLGIKTKSFETPVLLAESGYARLSNGDLTLIADCGEIGPSYQPGHAHADALSFEVWKGNQKVITNSGTYRYYDSPERRYQRSSAAHNTVVIDNKSSSQVWGAHRVAKRGHIIHKSIETNRVLTASFQTDSGVIHRRKWELSDGCNLSIEDSIDCYPPKEHLIVIHVHALDDKIEIFMQPEIEKNEIKTFFSPQFGILEEKRTFVLAQTIHPKDVLRTSIYF